MCLDNSHRWQSDHDEFDMEECYARATVAGTRAQSLTVIVSPLDLQGMIGMMQLLASRAHTIHEVYVHGPKRKKPQQTRDFTNKS